MANRSELEIVIDLEDNASPGLENANKSVTKFGDVAGGVALGGVALLGAALVGVGAHAIGMALDIEDAGAKATAQLGLTAGEAAEFEETMQSIFANNFGEDFGDIGTSLAEVDRQFQRIGGVENQQQLQRVTEQAFAMRDAFGKDVNETVSATVSLMDNLGLTSDEAMDFITRGMQRGLDSSGDFLDSITEYSTQFGNAGASAEEMFSLLESGLAGGMLGTDKVADLMKEFQISFLEGTDAQKAAFDELGLSYDDLIEQVNAGELTTTQAFQQVIDKLGEVEGAQNQQRIGVELMGEQFIDLGREAVLSLSTTQTGVEDLAGATSDLDAQYDTTRSNWQAASREMQASLIPVGESLMDMGTRIMPFLVDYIENTMTPAIVRWSDSLATGIERWNEGLGFFDNAPTAEEMFLGGALTGPSVRATPPLDRGVGEAWQPPAWVRSGVDPEVEWINRPDAPSFGPRATPITEQERLLNNLPITEPGYTVNNNFYGNADANDVEQGITQGMRALGVATP